MKQKHSVKDILIVKLDHAGDGLWTTPAVSTLRKNFPAARLRICCTPYTTPVWENNPAVDELIPYSGGSYPPLLGRPDLVLCLDTRTPAVKLTYSTRAPVRCGYFYFPRGLSMIWPLLLLTDPVLHPASRGEYVHEVEANRRLLERLGCNTETDTPSRLFLTVNEIEMARQLLREKGYRGQKLLSVHLPLKWLNGNWPVEHVIRLINRIGQYWPEASLLLSCGPGEESLLHAVLPLLQVPVLTITNQPFRIWAALLQQSLLLICRDCGPVHVAAALNIPVVGIFEESKRKQHTRWEPWLAPHRNVFRSDCFSAAAETDFVADLLDAAAALLPEGEA